MKDLLKIQVGLDDSVIPWIGKTAKMLSMHLRDSFAQHNINLTKEQFIILKVLYQEGKARQKDLAFITERNKGSLTRLVNTLEKKSLVARIPSEKDKRVNYIYLTKQGKIVFEKLQPNLRLEIQRLQKGITKEEMELTISILKKIQNNISI